MNYTTHIKEKFQSIFKDQSVIYKNTEYFYSDMTNIQIDREATLFINGNIVISINDTQISIPFDKKDKEDIEQIVNKLRETIPPYTDGAIFETPEQMYKFCLRYGYDTSLFHSDKINKFETIKNSIMPDENVLFTFMGQCDYISATEHGQYSAYAVTDRRILYANDSNHNTVESISWNNVNDFTMEQDVLMGILTFDTLKEVYRIGIQKNSVESIYSHVRRIFQQVKNNQPSVKQTNEKDPIEQIKEYKELLDMGIISQEEFDKKKKELLNL